MKKPLSFIDKVKIVYMWMIQHDKCGLITTCDQCESSRIVLIKSETSTLSDSEKVYRATYKCLKCDARGNNTEIWTKNI